MSENQSRSFLYGYRYQNLIGVSRLVDLLSDKVDTIYFEKKESRNDKFDDMKVYVNDQIHHYQIKSSYADNELKIINFSSKNDLDLFKLFTSWGELQQKYPRKEMFYHVYTTKSISLNNPLNEFIEKILPENTMLCENTAAVYHLKSEIIEHKKLQKIKESFEDSAQDWTVVKKFLCSVILETNQPSIPPEISPDQQIESDLEKKILFKISTLGLNKSPNNVEDASVFTSLFNFVNRDSITSHSITKNDLISHLNIKKSFGAIKNDIEFDQSLYVDVSKNLRQLNEQTIKNAGGIMGIKGKPGSGKTWLLTRWLKDLQQKYPETPPIWYYASIGVTGDDHFESRITKNQILSNLVDAIKKEYRISTDKNQYAADDSTFKELLCKLNKIANDKQRIISIIIDGLDHVDRIKKRANHISNSEKTVMDFLNEIEVPEHICFVFGTQEGPHIDKLKERFGNDAFSDISVFDVSETKLYLSKLQIPEEFITDDIAELIFQKTSGLPLLINYLCQQLKVESNIERIKNIPMTQGNVEKYYEYLWANIEESGYPRKIARYFSLLEFPIGVEFLEDLMPTHDRDGDKLKDCLAPLLFLLRKNQKNEMSIFHDSFREFILKENGFEDCLQIEYSKSICNVLMREDMFLNGRTFRYALKYKLKSGQFDELTSLINLKFVDNAIINFCNWDDLHNNLLCAIKAASKIGDPVNLIEKSLLNLYTQRRLEDLRDTNYYNLILHLYPDKLYQIFVTEDQLNLPLNYTVWLLGEALIKKIELPYDNIIKMWGDAWLKTSHGTTKYPPEKISVPHYGLLLFYKGGLEEIASWISQNNFSFKEKIDIFEKVLPLTTYENIDVMQNHSNVQEYWQEIRLLASFHYKKWNEFQTIFMASIHNGFILHLSQFAHILKKSGIESNNLDHLIHKTILNIPDTNHIDVENLREYEQQILLNAYCKNTACLEEYGKEIEESESTFFNKIINLIYQSSVMSQKDDSELTSEDVEKLLSSLSEFINYNLVKFTGTPGFYDENFYPYISDIIERTVSIIATKSDFAIKTRLIETIQQIGRKYAFTSLTLENVYEMIIKNSDAELRQLLISKISDEIDAADVQTMTEQCFAKARLCLQVGKQTAAKRFFEKGTRLTFSYGYHGDTLLYDFERISILLGRNNYLKRAKRNLELTEYLNITTDGDLNNSILSEIINDTVVMHSDAGCEIALRYGVDTNEFNESMLRFVENCSKCHIIIRYFLAKTSVIMSGSSYSSLDAFKIRHKLIQECIGFANTTLAKSLLNDLRVEMIRDFPEITTIMKTEFNYTASRLGLSDIEFNAIKTSRNDEGSSSGAIDYSHLSPEEAIQLFENSYGWVYGSTSFVDALIKIAYYKDKEKTKKLVNESLFRRCIESDYELRDTSYKFGKYLYNTKQIEKLNIFYGKIDSFLSDLFRERPLKRKRDFNFLETFVYEEDQMRTGCRYLVMQLTSSDIEVQRRAFTSIICCLRYNSTELLEYCVETILDIHTDATLKLKLTAIIHSHVVATKHISEEIISCARWLCGTRDRRLVTAGIDILNELGAE